MTSKTLIWMISVSGKEQRVRKCGLFAVVALLIVLAAALTAGLITGAAV